MASQFLIKCMLIFLTLGCLFTLVFGFGLMLRAAWCARLNQGLSQWVSTAPMLDGLEKPRDTQRAIYRHHRMVGILVIAGSSYALIALIGFSDLKSVAQPLRKLANPLYIEFWLRAIRYFLIAGNAAALGVGFALLLRPSALKGLEKWANRVYSPRWLGPALEQPRFSADIFVARHPRLFGAVIAIASAWVLATMAWFFAFR